MIVLCVFFFLYEFPQAFGRLLGPFFRKSFNKWFLREETVTTMDASEHNIFGDDQFRAHIVEEFLRFVRLCGGLGALFVMDLLVLERNSISSGGCNLVQYILDCTIGFVIQSKTDGWYFNLWQNLQLNILELSQGKDLESEGQIRRAQRSHLFCSLFIMIIIVGNVSLNQPEDWTTELVAIAKLSGVFHIFYVWILSVQIFFLILL
jgi:hypothetical protein